MTFGKNTHCGFGVVSTRKRICIKIVTTDLDWQMINVSIIINEEDFKRWEESDQFRRYGTVAC